MMRLSLISVGKLKDTSERALFARYQDRIAGLSGSLGFSKLESREFSESRGKTPELRKQQEAQDVLSAISGAEARVILDERGYSIDSRELATWMAEQRDDGIATMAFVIGGPDGHDETVRKAATKTVSLSALTLPHGLARIVVAEQIYRAMTILSRHPYHRD